MTRSVLTDAELEEVKHLISLARPLNEGDLDVVKEEARERGVDPEEAIRSIVGANNMLFLWSVSKLSDVLSELIMHRNKERASKKEDGSG